MLSDGSGYSSDGDSDRCSRQYGSLDGSDARVILQAASPPSLLASPADLVASPPALHQSDSAVPPMVSHPTTAAYSQSAAAGAPPVERSIALAAREPPRATYIATRAASDAAARVEPHSPWTGADQNTIGNEIYRLIQHQMPELACKIVGMLLELDPSEVMPLLDDAKMRHKAVCEALEVLSVSHDVRARWILPQLQACYGATPAVMLPLASSGEYDWGFGRLSSLHELASKPNSGVIFAFLQGKEFELRSLRQSVIAPNGARVPWLAIGNSGESPAYVIFSEFDSRLGLDQRLVLRIDGPHVHFPAGRGAAVEALRERVVTAPLCTSFSSAEAVYSSAWGDEFYQSTFSSSTGAAAVATRVTPVGWLPARAPRDRRPPLSRRRPKAGGGLGARNEGRGRGNPRSGPAPTHPSDAVLGHGLGGSSELGRYRSM